MNPHRLAISGASTALAAAAIPRVASPAYSGIPSGARRGAQGGPVTHAPITINVTVTGSVTAQDDLALALSRKIVPQITRAVQQCDRGLGIV